MPHPTALALSPVLRRLAPFAWWGGYLLYLYYIFTGWHEGPFVTWGFAGITMLAAVASYYFFASVVLPRWLLQRRWLLTGLGLVAMYYSWALLNYGWMSWLSHAELVSKNMHNYVHRILDKGLWTGVFSWHGVSIGLYDFGASTMPPLVVRFVRFLLTSANRSLRLERENLNLEVSFLKAQVNPHFLFNTLNNLYTLVVKQDARAPLIVQHLSDLLRYTLFEAAAPLAPLAEEVAFLEAYLELERLRYGRQVRIDYHADQPVAKLAISPLLLFPFVENAFKHGIDSSLDESWVSIAVRVEQSQLHFTVRNIYSPGAPHRAVGGVGLANVRQRLALHYAPADYELAISQGPEIYEVLLMLCLAPAAARLAPPTTPHPA
ncbi:MAG: sensor histidine kinase [Janthinobacterium lividum]